MDKTRSRKPPKRPRKFTKSTQTVDSNIFTEITKLQKQVELLQLENDTLKKQVSTYSKTDKTDNMHVLSHSKVQEMSKVNIKVIVCGCKGNCSSKKCGCMKENNKCTASCKCNSEICQNQELEDQDEESDLEDKENISMNGMATPSKELKVVVKKKLNNLTNDKNINHVEEQFNPMKPRHQLSRTPPRKNESPKNEFENIHMDNIQQPQLSKSPQIIASSFNIEENLIETEKVVDWLQHTAQLIPCKKCNRTFMPHRIKKHEACCKKI